MMKKIKYLPPLEQLILLCQKISKKQDELTTPIIVVGGQSIAYWYKRYNPNEQLPYALVSNDLDLASKVSEIAVLEKVLNVSITRNMGLPPSLAIFQLKDKKTDEIMSFNDALFIEPFDFEINNKITPTIVDIIDCPNGFDVVDFYNKKLLLCTESLESFFVGIDMEISEKLRILNPIACMESRLANLKDARRLGKNPEIEIERIQSLYNPIKQFILNKFRNLSYKEAKIYLPYLQYVLFKYRNLNKKYALNFEECFYPITNYMQNNKEMFPNVPTKFIETGLYYTNEQFKEQLGESVKILKMK